MKKKAFFRRETSIIAIICALLFTGYQAAVPTATRASSTPAGVVQTAALRDEINQFLGKELAVHLGDIKSLDKPTDRVLGAQTTGEYTWGTFMRSVAVYSELTGERTIANRDAARVVAQIGLIEY